MVIDKVNNSAIATENQIPLMPNIIGSTSTQASWNTSVLRKEMAAEMGPLFSAVKNAEP